jgi:hypothetical protein
MVAFVAVPVRAVPAGRAVVENNMPGLDLIEEFSGRVTVHDSGHVSLAALRTFGKIRVHDRDPAERLDDVIGTPAFSQFVVRQHNPSSKNEVHFNDFGLHNGLPR